MNDSPATILEQVKNELGNLGYTNNLLRENYEFDDASHHGVHSLTIPLAGFAQWPPSYRNACVGVVIANGSRGPQHVSVYSTLGAPLFFEVATDSVSAYRVERPGSVRFLETIPRASIHNAFIANRDSWSPDSIFRAKALPLSRTPVQLDFVDAGLLPALKGMIHQKLDGLLKDVIQDAITTNKKRRRGAKVDLVALFRLVFRCLAAKIFMDRKHKGDWGASDASVIIQNIQQFYGVELKGQSILADKTTQQVIWDKFRAAFNFQNLSVEDLAFVYENTLIRPETRKQYGVHSTPPIIADLMVDRLPFETIPQADRYILEPFAGHGVFLVAALRRLRELLPLGMTPKDRHIYFKERLYAIEIDTFATEVCRLSLTLADYPNPNGWEIHSADIFKDDVLHTRMRKSSIVLCNPPFEDFSPAEREHYGDSVKSTHKPYEILRRILELSPSMFGFVLPKSAILGGRYRPIQDIIARHYRQIDTVGLPDKIFHHSEQEAVLLLAHARDELPGASVTVNSYLVKDNDKEHFLATGAIGKKSAKTVNRSQVPSDVSLWVEPLSEVWVFLEGRGYRLGDLGEFHRGIEWSVLRGKHKNILVSQSPKSGFRKGLYNVPGTLEHFFAKNVVYLNTAEKYRRTTAHSLPWDRPKVVLNSVRIGRGPWRLAAYADTQGLVCTDNFICLWPKPSVPVEVLAAILNSPVVNAALWVKSYTRHNPIELLESLPCPNLQRIELEKVVSLVRTYYRVRSRLGPIVSSKSHRYDECTDILKFIDAQILRAFDLPPRMERDLLDLFHDYQRPVPFEFKRYFPPEFSPTIPLYRFLEVDMDRARVYSLLNRIVPIDSEEAHDFALELARR